MRAQSLCFWYTKGLETVSLSRGQTRKKQQVGKKGEGPVKGKSADNFGEGTPQKCYGPGEEQGFSWRREKCLRRKDKRSLRRVEIVKEEQFQFWASLRLLAPKNQSGISPPKRIEAVEVGREERESRE